tara:strand:- start:410 stop:544 length:135 start_codon:yes stop_codon:yes gene_type:complete
MQGLFKEFKDGRRQAEEEAAGRNRGNRERRMEMMRDLKERDLRA